MKVSELPPILFIDRGTATSILDFKNCIEAVEQGFAAYATGKSYSSGLIHIDTESGEFHIKAGGLRAPRSLVACKIGGGFFNNRATYGWPNIMGILALFDGDTGVLLTIIESGSITRIRTGAATAVAARYLAHPASSVATICGAGVQAEAQLRSLSMVLPIRKAFVWARSGAGDFAARMSESLGIRVEEVRTLREATLQSQVVVSCTSSKKWYIGRADIAPGTFVAAIGTDSPEKQELEPALLAASSVVCDIASQCATVGDLHHAIDAGLLRLTDIRGELGDVIIGRVPRRLSDDETIIFDSTGTAIQDVAAAEFIYNQALATGKGQLNRLY